MLEALTLIRTRILSETKSLRVDVILLVSKKQKRIFFIITLSEIFAQVASIPLLSKLQLVLQEGC